MANMERPPLAKAAGSGRSRSRKLDARNLIEHEWRRQAERLHSLGPRALGELIAEIIHLHPDLEARLRAYLRLTPDVLILTGGDRFPPAPLVVLEGGRR